MPLSQVDTVERFVSFTFAASEMVVEVDLGGTITYAAGAFHSRFGQRPEALVGRSVREVIVPDDHEAVLASLAVLAASGRLLPTLVRLSDRKRTPVALAGLALPDKSGPARLCLTFARLPKPLPRPSRSSSASEFTRLIETRLRARAPGSLGLLEVAGDGALAMASGEMLGGVLGAAAPGAVANEIAPGRFTVLGTPGSDLNLEAVVRLLEDALRNDGADAAVRGSSLALATDGLSSSQVAHALRHALSVFARDGADGLRAAGLGGGLAGYIRGATAKAEALRRAIRDGNFSLLYQPIVALADRTVHHYEALIRPLPITDCAFANPQEFVTLVEALGLADELDFAVATAASRMSAASRQRIAFNVSSQSVQSGSFCARLVRLLAASPACQAGLLMVEMTETAAIDDLEEASRTAEALRGLGVPFCLDDFGAGAADIRLLRSLAADIVKLDGSYVAGVAEDGRERAFVAGMVEIARAAGVEIVAERVETEEEATVLLRLGVQYGQGWLFGRPGALPAG